jgi:hypothetical protein
MTPLETCDGFTSSKTPPLPYDQTLICWPPDPTERPMRDLPPTPTLRAFEAAARHRTFTAASEELNVTQSAISHQIQHLEELWGRKLFERGRSLKLTAAGDALAPIIRQFLVSLEATLTGLRLQRDRHPLRLSLTQSLASRWLLPRLPDLEAAQPDPCPRRAAAAGAGVAVGGRIDGRAGAGGRIDPVLAGAAPTGDRACG